MTDLDYHLLFVGMSKVLTIFVTIIGKIKTRQIKTNKIKTRDLNFVIHVTESAQVVKSK